MAHTPGANGSEAPVDETSAPRLRGVTIHPVTALPAGIAAQLMALTSRGAQPGDRPEGQEPSPESGPLRSAAAFVASLFGAGRGAASNAASAPSAAAPSAAAPSAAPSAAAGPAAQGEPGSGPLPGGLLSEHAFERVTRLSGAVASSIFDDLLQGALHPGDSGPPPASEKAIAALQRCAPCESDAHCPICLVDLEGEAMQMPCGHHFHDACLTKWLRSHNTCPVCRATIEASDTPRQTPFSALLHSFRERGMEPGGAVFGTFGPSPVDPSGTATAQVTPPPPAAAA